MTDDLNFPVFVDESNGLWLMGEQVDYNKFEFKVTEEVYLNNPYIICRDSGGVERKVPVNMGTWGLGKDCVLTVILTEWSE